MTIIDTLNQLISTPQTRKFSCRIADDHLLDEDRRIISFKPRDGYIQIRLKEMFLKDKRRYWAGFIPMTIAVTDFLYDDSQQTVPVYIGNQFMKSIEQHVKDQYVEYKDTNIIGPVPYLGGDVGLFIGLFRIMVKDFLKQIFDCLETVINAFDSTNLSNYLNIADNVSAGLSTLLGMQKQVQLQIGHRHVFSDVPSEIDFIQQGYLLYANCPETDLDPDNLWIKNSSLQIGPNKNALEPFHGADYCLVKIIHRDKRNDYVTMPFHQKNTSKLSRKYSKQTWRKLSGFFCP